MTDKKAVKISFDDNQIPEVEFFGEGTDWSVRDILHIKRILTGEYKKFMRKFVKRGESK